MAITRSVVIKTPLQAGKTRARGKTGGAVSFNHDGSLLGVATFFSFADTVTSDSAHRSSFVPSISGIYHHYHSTSRVSCVGRSVITRRYNPDPHVPNTCNKSEQQSLSAVDPFTFFPLLKIEAHLVARAARDSQFNHSASLQHRNWRVRSQGLQVLAIKPKLLRVQNADQQCRSTRLGRSGTKVPRLGPTTNPTRRLIFLINHTSHLTSQRLILLLVDVGLSSANRKQQTANNPNSLGIYLLQVLSPQGFWRGEKL